MRDVAAERDERGITIQRVGVRDIHLPVMVREKGGGYARVTGVFQASVELPKHERGTHMSRFVEILAHWSKHAVAMPEMREMLGEIRSRFHAYAAHLDLGFRYFLDKRSPATGLACQLDYQCSFTASDVADEFDFLVSVEVPVITVCPCSREISERGAHSQRAVIRASVRSRNEEIIWLEDLIPLLENQGSEQVYPMLKREDEKLITERSYENPKFVEDVIRDSVTALKGLPQVAWFSVSCESFESIHNHSAYAQTQWPTPSAG
ncbi:MAG: GTP cyclohydrolase FolE2 [Armatimonadota bacterium]